MSVKLVNKRQHGTTRMNFSPFLKIFHSVQFLVFSDASYKFQREIWLMIFLTEILVSNNTRLGVLYSNPYNETSMMEESTAIHHLTPISFSLFQISLKPTLYQNFHRNNNVYNNNVFSVFLTLKVHYDLYYKP